MGRRVFISFQHDDKLQAQGFNLLQWNKYVDFDFVGRHLLSPVNSENEAYIKKKIMEQINGSSVTAALIGEKTAESDWVRYEIEKSIEKGNGIIGIRLKGAENVRIPPALKKANAKVINWDPSTFSDEIERAALIAGRPPLGPPSSGSASGGRGCIR